MTPGTVSLVNAIVLMGMGACGYLLSDSPSPTAFIPVGFGVILLLLNPGVRAHNKTIAHIAVLATMLILLGLFMPMKGAVERGDNWVIIRVALMILTTVAAMVAFIKSFVDARRARQQSAPEN